MDLRYYRDLSLNLCPNGCGGLGSNGRGLWWMLSHSCNANRAIYRSIYIWLGTELKMMRLKNFFGRQREKRPHMLRGRYQVEHDDLESRHKVYPLLPVDMTIHSLRSCISKHFKK